MNTQTNDLFTANNPSNEDQNVTPELDGKAFLEANVGEGKKYVDSEALAKATAHGQMHIQKLEDEMARLREDLKQRMTNEQLLTKIEEMRNETPTDTPTNVLDTNAMDLTDTPSPTSLNNETVQKLIDDTVSARISEAEQARQIESNRIKVHQKAYEVLGPQYQRVLDERATALNLNKEHLSQLAVTNPEGFINIMVEPKQFNPVTNDSLFGAPTTQVNSAALVSDNVNTGPHKTQSYYDKILREEPERYWSPAIQNEMFESAMELGDAFKDVKEQTMQEMVQERLSLSRRA